MHIMKGLLVFLGSFLMVHCAGQQLSFEDQQALDVFNCSVRVLEPYVGSAKAAEETMRQFYMGNVQLDALLYQLGHTAEDVLSFAQELRTCLPVVAPPPAPGGKVL